MKILSWNVNGIRAAQKKGFLTWLKTYSPDILCLQETKAYPEQLENDLAHPDGYNTYWNNPKRKGYAGVAFFAKEAPKSVKYTFSAGSIDEEGRFLRLDYNDVILINVYFPNGRMNKSRLEYKMNFYNEFLKYANSLKNKKTIVCGDFNTAHKEIDLARPGQNEMYSGFLPEEREWMDEFVKHGYIDTFREFNQDPGNYSWWDFKTQARQRNVGWRIDYFFASKKIMKSVKTAFIMSDVSGSDHCPVGIELD